MRRLIAILIALLLVLPTLLTFTGCSDDRESVLRIYNWEDYIDPEVLDGFIEYYKEKYGVELTIQYETFDTNETMYTKIDKAHEDYDLCCPSEYMIEKMKNQGLILPLDKEIVGDVYEENVPEYIKEQFAIVSGNTADTLYSVGYMWGTLGIIYNEDEVDINDLKEQGWGILWNEKYSGKIFMKDSIRDSYAVGNMYVYQDEYISLRRSYESGDITKAEYGERMLELFNRTDENTVELVKEALITQKETVDAMYDVDNDKNAMVNGTAYLDVAWSGDAYWAVQESIDADNGVNLNFFIPYEGTNVWFDGWVIPKYAKNVQAANEFIAYILRQDVSVAIMDYIGYPSVVSGDEVYEYAKSAAFDFDIERDASYFFEGSEPTVLSHMQYPDLSDVTAAAVMRDFGEANSSINEMWAMVKGNTLTPIIIIVDSIVGIALLIMLVKKIYKLVKER